MILATSHTFIRCFLTLLVVGIFLLPFSSAAFFSNTESSPAQIFGAASLTLAPVTPQPAALSVSDVDSATTSMFITTTAASIAAHYDVVTVGHTGDAALCNELELIATSTEVVTTSALAGYESGVVTTFGAWELGVRDTSSTTTVGTMCQVTLLVTAWQDNMSKGAGYGDTAEVVLTITRGAGAPDVDPPATGTVALNEIFPAPQNQADEPLDREWVELYNGTHLPVDVAGWSLSEIAGSNEKFYTITNVASDNGTEVGPYDTASTVIAPGGFLVLQYVGNRLNNSGDTVRLYDAEGGLVDEFAYPRTNNGDAHARVPDGVGDWVVQAPTPNASNEPDTSAFRFSSAGLSDSSDDETAAVWSEPEKDDTTIPKDEVSVTEEVYVMVEKPVVDEVESQSEVVDTTSNEESTDSDMTVPDRSGTQVEPAIEAPAVKPEEELVHNDAATSNDITD